MFSKVGMLWCIFINGDCDYGDDEDVNKEILVSVVTH